MRFSSSASHISVIKTVKFANINTPDIFSFTVCTFFFILFFLLIISFNNSHFVKMFTMGNFSYVAAKAPVIKPRTSTSTPSSSSSTNWRSSPPTNNPTITASTSFSSSSTSRRRSTPTNPTKINTWKVGDIVNCPKLLPTDIYNPLFDHPVIILEISPLNIATCIGVNSFSNENISSRFPISGSFPPTEEDEEFRHLRRQFVPLAGYTGPGAEDAKDSIPVSISGRPAVPLTRQAYANLDGKVVIEVNRLQPLMGQGSAWLDGNALKALNAMLEKRKNMLVGKEVCDAYWEVRNKGKKEAHEKKRLDGEQMKAVKRRNVLEAPWRRD